MSTDNYQNLIVGKGDKIVDGKTHFKDFIHVTINDHKEALTLAMDILRQIETNQFRAEAAKSSINFSLTGTLEPAE